MKHTSKKYLGTVAATALLMVLSSCSDDPKEVYVDEMSKNQIAYITTGVSYPNAVVFKNISMGSADLKVQDGKLVFDEKKGLTIPNGPGLETDLFFRTIFPVKTQVSGTIAPITDAESFVERYNNEHKLDGESRYRLLPSEWYALKDSHATIAAGKKETIIKFIPNENAAWESGKYILPLSLTLDDDTQVTLSENLSSLSFFFQISEPEQENEYPDGSRLLTPEEYTVSAINSGSQQTLTGDNVYQQAFDQDPNTEWDLYYSSLYGDSTVEIEFDEPHYLSHVSVLGGDYYFYVYAKEEGESRFKSNSFEAGTLVTVSMEKDLGLDMEKKVKTVRIRNYYTNIADVYFLVHD